MSPRTNKSKTLRQTALCYVRQSFTRDSEDMNSPERQRSYIQAVCERNGWTPEWYEDISGHKSGRSEKNRPQWLALKSRIGDPDVIALVANDLSRLHRKGWRVGDLIELLNENQVELVLAAPGREVDTTTLKGRMFLQFGAIIDEFYAEDISQRAKESISYRKAQGKSIGMPPFGTSRGEDGLLKPSQEGAWLLRDGKFVAGTVDNPPDADAIWKGYYEAAGYILKLYATGKYGLEKIAYTLSDEGWAFRDRSGNPRQIERDDVRRVVANWAEYGGLVPERKAKDRPAYVKQNIDEIPFRHDRAVFPIQLLKNVAEVRQQRTVRPKNDGVRHDARVYPLAGITYCAHCERIAIANKNPKARTRLGGMGKGQAIPRYRHRSGLKCGCSNKSVLADVIEEDFIRLLSLLSVHPDALALMTELAIQADRQTKRYKNDQDLEREKQEAIALCYRRIEAVVHLYKDGVIDRSEYLRTRETNEREIGHWEARTTETAKLAVELTMCIDAVDRLVANWEKSSDEDKQGLAQSLFENIVYDLDRQQIVSFKLKPWADRFLVFRSALYNLEDTGVGEKQHALTEDQGVYTAMPHRDIYVRCCHSFSSKRCFTGAATAMLIVI
jgi:DNA invertase Pin-like site-specific DNA recombinase